MSKSKRVFIVLGNGFSIDFLNHLANEDSSIWSNIDLANLFSHGTKLKWPSNSHPGFLSKKYMPNLWGLGARPYLSQTESMEIIEKIVTSVNVYALKGRNDIDDDKKYLLAYKELTAYLKYLFVHYDSQVKDIPDSVEEWSWGSFFKSLNDSDHIEEVVIVTYNYDLWLERVLKKLKIKFELPPMISGVEDCKFRLFKPHGSISFKYREDLPISSFNINYQDLKTDCSAMDIKIKYDDIHTNNPIVFLIPPAGDVNRTGDGWNKTIRQLYEPKLKDLGKEDLLIISGLSYWHVDRAELDGILISPSEDVDLVNINPKMDQYFESVIDSLFTNYVHFDSSDSLKEIIV